MNISSILTIGSVFIIAILGKVSAMINVTKNKYGIIHVIKLSFPIFFVAAIFSLPFFHNLIILNDKFIHSYKLTFNDDLTHISNTCSDDSFKHLYNQISDRINRKDTSKIYSFIDVHSDKFATAYSVLIHSKSPITNELIFLDDLIKPVVNMYFSAPLIQELYAECLYHIQKKNEYINKLTKNSYKNISTQKNYIILNDILSSKIINQSFYKIDKINIRSDKTISFLKIILVSISVILLGIYFSLNFSLKSKK